MSASNATLGKKYNPGRQSPKIQTRGTSPLKNVLLSTNKHIFLQKLDKLSNERVLVGDWWTRQN